MKIEPGAYVPDGTTSAFLGPAAVDANQADWRNIQAAIVSENLVDQVADFSSYLNDASELDAGVCIDYPANADGLSAAQFYSAGGSDGGSTGQDSSDLMSDASSDFERTGFALDRGFQVLSQLQEANLPIQFSPPTSTLSPSSPSQPFVNVPNMEHSYDPTSVRDTNSTSNSFPSLDKKPVTAEDKRLRKKELNRRAAMRCRRRKVERERELEAMVRTLQQRNSQLLQELVRMGSHLASLERTIIQHVTSGCTTFCTKKTMTNV